jgi:hypothetical protein
VRTCPTCFGHGLAADSNVLADDTEKRN